MSALRGTADNICSVYRTKPTPNNIIVIAGMAAAVGAVLTFCLRLIASQITKLFWPLQQSAFPAFPFFRRCGAIGVPVDDLASQIGRFGLDFELGGVAGALRSHASNGPAFIVPTLSGTLAWVMCSLWALVHHHAVNMPPFAGAG